MPVVGKSTRPQHSMIYRICIMRSYDRIVAIVQDKQMTMATATERPGERGSGPAGGGRGHGASDQVVVSKQNGAR